MSLPKPSLPSRRDWAWLLALVLIGSAAGLLSNTLNPRGINLSIAFGWAPVERTP
jgi:hypothetical protein